MACLHDLVEYNGSIGLPVPSTEVRMVDEEGNVLPNTGTGELQVRGPQVMQGYWQRPEATKDTINEDGWLSTGDIVKFDDEGFLHIVDRKKDMMAKPASEARFCTRLSLLPVIPTGINPASAMPCLSAGKSMSPCTFAILITKGADAKKEGA